MWIGSIDREDQWFDLLLLMFLISHYRWLSFLIKTALTICRGRTDEIMLSNVFFRVYEISTIDPMSSCIRYSDSLPGVSSLDLSLLNCGDDFVWVQIFLHPKVHRQMSMAHRTPARPHLRSTRCLNFSAKSWRVPIDWLLWQCRTACDGESNSPKSYDRCENRVRGLMARPTGPNRQVFLGAEQWQLLLTRQMRSVSSFSCILHQKSFYIRKVVVLWTACLQSQDAPLRALSLTRRSWLMTIWPLSYTSIEKPAMGWQCTIWKTYFIRSLLRSSICLTFSEYN